jgi:hypothetical protein
MKRGPRSRFIALALALGALLALAVPPFAAAETYVVNSTGGKTLAEGAECTTAPLAECTLRAAIEAANGTADADTIGFSPSVFNGEAGDTISPSSLPAISTAITLDGTDCNAGSSITCISAANTGGNPLLVLSTGETKVEHLSLEIPSGVVGVRASGSAGSGSGVEVLDNTITMPGTGLPSTGIEISFGASGDLLEGNVIDASAGFNFNYPISLRGSSNLILGNEVLGSGCCEAGISLELGAHGNQIGGDTAASENVIEDFDGGAVYMNNSPTDSSHNEVRRNRGANGQSFIYGASVVQPTVTEALQSSVTGTAEPGATVRLFRKATESSTEIEGFLGEATADVTTGDWKVTFAKAPTGTFVAATQTVSGSTSGLGETKALVEEPETGGGGENGGGDSSGGNATTTTPPATTAPITSPAPAPTKPTVKITKGPKKTSTSTTAKFTFKATNVSGAKFECKLDNAKWASCKSPKTYKKLKPKAHTFQVRAKANGLTSAVAKSKFTVKA